MFQPYNCSLELPWPPPGAAPAEGAQGAQGAPGAPGARQLLIDSVFRALNRSASGQLSAEEMRPFAEKTGAWPWTAEPRFT